MKLVISIIIFLCVFLLYLHIKYHLTTSNSTQVYVFSGINKNKLEAVAYFKQPIQFDYNINIEDTLVLSEVNIIDTNKYEEVPLTSMAAELLFKKPDYYTEYNKLGNDLIHKLSVHDTLFEPINSIINEYDVIFGSDKVCTQLKHNLAYRHILCVHSGDPITIKCMAPKYNELLAGEYNYNRLNVISKVDIWQDEHEDKMITLELSKHEAISIPYYWWYSIKLNANTKIYSFKYYTAMNALSISPVILTKYYQQYNSKNIIKIKGI